MSRLRGRLCARPLQEAGPLVSIRRPEWFEGTDAWERFERQRDAEQAARLADLRGQLATADAEISRREILRTARQHRGTLDRALAAKRGHSPVTNRRQRR